MKLAHKEKCSLYTPHLTDAIFVAERIPVDEIQQVEAFTGIPYDAEQLALWFHGTQFKIACQDSTSPIALCGFSSVGPGVYRTFFLATEYAWSEHGKELTHLTRSGMQEIIAREGIRRLETLCLASRKRAQTWYKMLGLVYESTLKSYASNGEDAVMFTYIAEK